MKPVFEFKCSECEEVQESQDRTAELYHCGQVMRRVYSLGGFVLKGSGFYSVDNRLKKGI